MSLHDKKYIVIRKILSEEVTKIYYDYLVNKEKGCITLIENKMINPFSKTTDFLMTHNAKVHIVHMVTFCLIIC